MSDAPITLDKRDGATVLRMDDGKVNALSLAFLDLLGDKVDEALGTGQPVVVTGNEQVFSAGLDLEEVPTLGADGLRTLLDRMDEVVEPILKAPVPVVAALDGVAIAGGAIVALACDHRVASPEAEIGTTELEVGIAFPPTDRALFTERLPARTVRRTILDPRRSSGQEALDLGWVDELADDPVEAGVAAARRIGGPNDAAFQDVKRELNEEIIETWEAFEGQARDDYIDLATSKETEQAMMEGIRDVMGE